MARRDLPGSVEHRACAGGGGVSAGRQQRRVDARRQFTQLSARRRLLRGIIKQRQMLAGNCSRRLQPSSIVTTHRWAVVKIARQLLAPRSRCRGAPLRPVISGTDFGRVAIESFCAARCSHVGEGNHRASAARHVDRC